MPSSPVPPPKRLLRSRQNQMLGGVCAGVADYLNMDPTLIRILTVVISLFTGVPVLIYLIALFVVPEAPKTDYPPVGATPPYGSGSAHGRGFGRAPAPRPREDEVWGPAGPPWEQPQPAPATPDSSSPFRGLKRSTPEPTFARPAEPAPGPSADPAAPPAPSGPAPSTGDWEQPTTDPDPDPGSADRR